MNNKSRWIRFLLIVLCMLLFIAFTLVFTSGTSDAQNFRKVSWGMSLMDVIEIEGNPIKSDVFTMREGFSFDGILYRTQVENIEVNLVYGFDEGGLAWGVYSTDKWSKVKEFFDLAKDTLEYKYGEPDESYPFDMFYVWILDETTVLLQRDLETTITLYAETSFYDKLFDIMQTPSNEAQEKF